MSGLLATNTKIDIAKTYESAKTITGITKAATGVLTSAAHGYATGDIVVLAVAGMAELDGQAVRVAAATTNTVELEGIDTTDFGTFSSGSVQRISAWERLSNATDFSASEGKPEKVPTTRLIDTKKTFMYGLSDATEITVNGQLDPFGTAVVEIRKASRAGTPRAVLVTLKNGIKCLFDAYCSGGEGFSASPGQVMKQSYSFTQIAEMVWYAA